MNKVFNLVVLLSAITMVINKEAFLQEKVTPKLALPSVFDIARFATGFFNGVAIFTNLPHQDECVARVTDPQLVSEVFEIVNLINSFGFRTDYINILKEIAMHAVSVFGRAQTAYQTCEVLGNEEQIVLDHLVAHLNADDYFQRVTQHTLLNIGNLAERTYQANAALQEGKFNLSGNDFGSLVNFALLFDFKQ